MAHSRAHIDEAELAYFSVIWGSSWRCSFFLDLPIVYRLLMWVVLAGVPIIAMLTSKRQLSTVGNYYSNI